MSRQIQIRRGSATEHATFTGAIGEITMDTTNKTLRVHDGETAGGTILARQNELPPVSADYVIETQIPTAENNYTWYRKYKSGWVEQGGRIYFGNLNDGAASADTINLIIPMHSENYSVSISAFSSSGYNRLSCGFGPKTITTLDVGVRNIGGKTNDIYIYWNVYGN